MLWALDTVGAGLPRTVDRGVLLLAAVAGGAYLVRLARRLWTGELLDPFSGRTLLLLVAAALVIFFAGLGHEIGGRYFADEGTFLAQAQRINGGRPLRAWFVYPHFLFYWDAFALWLAGLGGRLVPAAAKLVWGVEGDLYVAALVTRLASATLAALAVVPVFLAGRRVGGPSTGPVAGAAAGLLLILSPTFVEVGRTNLADVPGTFFAACTLCAVAALLERESARGYLAAGIAAGLAAGSKYPAGVAAVALAGPWLRGGVIAAGGGRDRLRRELARRLGWAGLAAAGALAALVVTTPSLLAFPRAAFAGSGADLTFGARLYSQAGWQGIVRDSNLLYYLRELDRAFGWPAFLLAAVGVAGLARETRRRALWLLVFPAAFLILLLTLRVALRRNLMPVLPCLAVLLGVGLAGCLTLARRLPARDRRWAAASFLLAAGALLAALALPAAGTVAQLLRAGHPTTREEAAAWMREHLPPGSFLVQEQYTPVIGPETLFPARRPRFAARLPLDVLRDPTYDFVFLSSEAYDRFLTRTNLENLANDQVARRYREIFATFPLVREWTPGRFQDGPVLRLYRNDPDPIPYTTSATFAAADALVSDPTMRPEGATEINFTATDQWALFKVYFAAGTYTVRLDGDSSNPAALRVSNRTNTLIADTTFNPAAGDPPTIPEATFDLPNPDKAFLYLELPPTSHLRGLTLTPTAQ